MVYKVSKGGVRSGNTLRGLHSLRTKRYAGQACIVGRSSLPRKDVQRLLEESTDDASVSSALTHTDVVLSLNKKKRWSLPATVTHMIHSGQFSNTQAMVSVLERHKLKRSANCVGFACNKSTKTTRGVEGSSKNTSAMPDVELQGQKKYFSFHLGHIDSEESKRQFKRRKCEEHRKLMRGIRIKGKKEQYMRTINVTTVEGRIRTKDERIMSSTKPEYRLEVFYPCPQSCSLTFNPKYTDVVAARNDDGEMEVRSNVKSSQKGRQKKHRKRVNATDMNSYTTEVENLERDIEGMWEEDFDFEEKMPGCTAAETEVIFNTSDSFLTHHRNAEGEQNTASASEGCSFSKSRQSTFSDSVFACLIENAERTRQQQHWEGVKSSPRRRRRSRRSSNSSNSDSSDDRKPHIVRVNRNEQRNELTNNESEALMTGSATFESKEQLTLSAVPVVLSRSDVNPDTLADTFGARYVEVNCQPRRFCINITDDVINLFSQSRSGINEAAYTTCLVFIYAGCYDDGLDTYNVALNCAGCLKRESVSYGLPYEQTTASGVINAFIGNLLDLKEIGELEFPDDVPAHNTNISALFQNSLLEKMKIKMDNFFTQDELSRVISEGDLQEDTGVKREFKNSLLQFSKDVDADIFCEICYDSINPTQHDATTGMQLNACGHQFCETCWRTHLRTRLREGSVRMVCPGYKCDTQLGVATLLSLLHVTEVAQILRRACEEELETRGAAKWCPNPTCGRVIRLTKGQGPGPGESEASGFEDNHDTVVDVACACGERLCFSCLEPAHWPARCHQAEEYLSKVSTIKPIKETTDDTAANQTKTPEVQQPTISKFERKDYIEMEGRVCPRCRRFIDKNGGCPHMSCKCGYQFCWTCLSPWIGHYECKPNPNVVYEYSRRVRVRHVTASSLTPDKSTKTAEAAATTSSRQKSSMYQRALQQRTEATQTKSPSTTIKELALNVAKIAARDDQFKKEVLLQCGVPQTVLSDPATQLDRFSIAPAVVKYLQSCQEAKLSVHHVTEFTFVLLQDCPPSLEKQRVLHIASDLAGFCSFTTSILLAGSRQNARAALTRLADIQTWTSRAIDRLLVTVNRLNRDSSSES